MLVIELVKHREDLVGYARGIVGGYAEDVVSDLSEYFLRGRFNAPPNPLPLLMWYTKCRCIDYLRSSLPMQELPRDLQIIIEESVTDPRIEYIEAALRELPPLVSRLIVLNRVEGITVPQLAKETGISIQRIKYLIRSGKKQIQDNETRRT